MKTAVTTKTAIIVKTAVTVKVYLWTALCVESMCVSKNIKQ
jgi:hypothetical protein